MSEAIPGYVETRANCPKCGKGKLRLRIAWEWGGYSDTWSDNAEEDRAYVDLSWATATVRAEMACPACEEKAGWDEVVLHIKGPNLGFE